MLVALFSIPAFYLLGTPAIYIWDEAVYVNASWDIFTGSALWIPEHGEYNTKPPLVLWMQALCLHLFPSPEWAVRLPSAIAVTGILILLTLALRRWSYSTLTCLLVMVCFVGHEGFIRHHIARTGDLDAVMSFFTIAYSLVVLDAVHQRRWSPRHHLWFFTMVICAFFAKSIGGWLMLGPLLIVWILTPIRKVLVSRSFWLAGLFVISACLLYYFLREMVQPGYLALVWHSEYKRMLQNVMPWHEHGAAYYFTNFVILRTYTPWIFLLAISILVSLLLIRDRSIKQQLLHWIILSLGFMLLISYPAVKLEWYDAPAYAFFALITGVVIGHYLDRLPLPWRHAIWIPILFVLGRKLNFIRQDTHTRHAFELEGAMLRNTEADRVDKVFMKVDHPEHRLQLDFYRKVKMRQTGRDVPVIDHPEQAVMGDRIIIAQQQGMQELLNRYELDTLTGSPGTGYMIIINKVKSSD